MQRKFAEICVKMGKNGFKMVQKDKNGFTNGTC